MADTKTYLKIPYRDGQLRSRPFNDSHLTALTMAQQMKDPRRQVNIVLRTLSRLLGEEAYEEVTNDFVDEEIDVHGLTALLLAIVEATAAYRKAQKGTETEPESEPDPGTGGE